MKTFSATPSDIEQQWYIVDAEGMVLGRLATEVARILFEGKTPRQAIRDLMERELKAEQWR